MGDPARKKVLYVITKSNWGGAQRYVYDLATHLPKDRFEVAVALGGEGELARKLRDAGITVFPLSNLQRDLSFTADVGSFASLYRVLRSYRPHLVHLNSSKAGGLGALAARLLGVPRILFTAHGWPFEERRNIFWRAFALLGSYATALLSHAVIVLSKRDLSLGRRMPLAARKMHLVYNGIDERLQFGSGEVIRRAFPPGVFISGTVGELTKNKNHLALIEAARKDPQAHIAIVGEGEERGRLERAIQKNQLQDRVKLFGFLPAQEVMRGFDTFVLPSLKEGLPYVLLEAKLAGLPIKANRVGGVSDILDATDPSLFTLERMVRQTLALY